MKPMNVPARDDIDIADLYWEGETVKQQEHDELEASKLGIYRAGSAGMVLDTGHVTGTCPRKAFLRSHGIQYDVKKRNDVLMMENGVWNEDIWVDVLSRSWQGVIKREEECGVRIELDEDIVITGRPDVLLCDADGVPMKGLELKNASSVWTGRDVASERSPKIEHMIQACLYMWQWQVPFDLCYASRVKYVVPSKTWIERLFPKQGQPGSEIMEFNDKGGSKSLLPFMITYPLRLVDGSVEYKVDDKWWPTPVNVESILRFYRGVHSMNDHDSLPNRPVVLKLSGGKGYDPCSPDYCELAATCKKYEGRSRREWQDAVMALARELQERSSLT